MKLLVCAVLLAIVAQAAFSAPRCTFGPVSPVRFGVYNVFDTLPNNNGVGSITIDCQGGGGPFDVTLSTGQIPAGQDAAVGTYTDDITAIANF